MYTLNEYDYQSSGWARRRGRGKPRPFVRWFNLTSLSDPPEDASFLKREAARRSRLISIVAGFLLLLFAVGLPAAIMSGNISFLRFILPIPPVILIAMLLNRAGRTFFAGLIIACAAELTLSAIVLTTTPFDIPDVQLYGLLVIGELLTVSLLPGKAVFIAAFYNSAVIIVSLFYQSQTRAMAQEAHRHLVTLLLNPVGVQLLLAGVTYLWVSSTLRAIARADYAEVVASLEREIGRQATMVAEDKLILEAKINEIVQFHINTMNSSMSAKFPFSEETKMLWPLINIIHTLQRRVQRSFYTDFELRRLKQTIIDYADFVYTTDLVQREERWPQTKTELDLLLHAVQQQMRKHPDPVSAHEFPTRTEGPITQVGEGPISYGGNWIHQGVKTRKF